MANQEHLDILKQGVELWNQWREEHTDIEPDLSEANLKGADLTAANLSGTELMGANLYGANLTGANLRNAILWQANLGNATLEHADLPFADFQRADLGRANLSWANLNYADLSDANLKGANLINTTLEKAHLARVFFGSDDLSHANLTHADLREADLSGAKLRKADLSGAYLNGAYLRYADLGEANLSHADLSEANLSHADLTRANLHEAILRGSVLVSTNLEHAILTNCSIYGISVWDVELKGASQENLVITDRGKSTITVGNLKIAQFIYLLLNNAEVRDIIDTLTSQVVLLLGHFPPERKEVLDTLSNELRSQKYSPVLFNFEGTENKDVIATVRTLANMARFVLLDLTGLSDTAREIAHDIIPHCVIPIRPLLFQGSHGQGYELFRELQHKYRWVVAPYHYKDLPDLQSSFQEKLLQPINEKMIALKQKNPLKMFLGYAPEDKNMLSELKRHLRPVERAGLIEVWDDQDVAPGEEKGRVIEKHLSDARAILLLLSPAFLDSDDCYDQMSMAIERYEQAKARVIPILLRPCAWKSTPLKELQPLPKDGEPISQHNKDDGFFEVSEEIAEVIKTLG